MTVLLEYIDHDYLLVMHWVVNRLKMNSFYLLHNLFIIIVTRFAFYMLPIFDFRNNYNVENITSHVINNGSVLGEISGFV